MQACLQIHWKLNKFVRVNLVWRILRSHENFFDWTKSRRTDFLDPWLKRKRIILKVIYKVIAVRSNGKIDFGNINELNYAKLILSRLKNH
jgi:hypothetical protein